MPGSIDRTPSVSSIEQEHEEYGQDRPVVDDDSYPGLQFHGQDEEPLSKQLEPIAVVGMGKFSLFVKRL